MSRETRASDDPPTATTSARVRVDVKSARCGACGRAFDDRGDASAENGLAVTALEPSVDEDEDEEEEEEEEETRARAVRRLRSLENPAIGAICPRCYQREYRRRVKASARGPCAACEKTTPSGQWMRSQVGPSKGQDLCQRCYEEEKMARKDALQVTRNAKKCAKCDRVGTGSAHTYWYRSEALNFEGLHVCKSCYLLEYRERMNADPNVSCDGCGKTELSTGNWRKNKTTGGHWCNACYKKNRLDRMNDDPNVVCWKCDAMTSWGPEWRRNGNAYVCMKCTQLEHQRKLLAKTKRKRTADATPKTASRRDDE